MRITFELEQRFGFEAGDWNKRRYVKNGPVTFTDQSGLEEKKVEPVSKTPQSEKIVFADEVLYAHFTKTRITSRVNKEVINKLIQLRDQKSGMVKLNVWYVVGPRMVGKWANHAVATGKPNSYNYCFAHGTGETNQQVSEEALKEVKRAFSGLKEDDTRRFGFNGCYPGDYNGTILPTKRVPTQLGKETTTVDTLISGGRFRIDLLKIIEYAEADKKPVEINLYFGEEGTREEFVNGDAKKDIKADERFKTTDLRFAKWKPIGSGE